MKKFTAALIQIAPKNNDIPYNLEKMSHWLKRAKTEHNADFALFPESITTGFNPGMDKDKFWDILDPVPGRTTDEISKVAKELGMHIVLPIYEKGEKRGIIYNSSVFIDDQGQILGNYRKTHPFPTERLENGGWTTPGNKTVLVNTKLGKFGMIICYDGDFPELSRVLAIQGAEIILRPSALMRSYDIWEMTNMARAYDNHVYFLACNAIGNDAGGSYFFGSSMILSPNAQKLALARGAEEIICATLEEDPARYITYGSKDPMLFDHLKDRNISAYAGILDKAESVFAGGINTKKG